MSVLLAASLLGVLHQPAAEVVERPVVVRFQMPNIDGHERVASSLQAHAESVGLDLEVQLYDPSAFDLTQLGPRSRTILAKTDAANVLWLVATPSPMRLYLFEGSTEAVWARQLDRDQLDAIAAEVVPNASVEIGLALKEGEIRDMVPVDPAELEPEPDPEPIAEPQPEPEPEPEPEFEPSPAPDAEPITTAPRWPSRAPAPFWLGINYVGNTFSEARPWHSGVALRLTWKPRPRMALWVRYTYVVSQTVELEPVTFDLRRHPVTLGLGTRWPLAPHVDVVAGGAASIDPTTRVIVQGEVQAQDDGLRVFSSALAYAGVGVHPTPRVRLGVDLALDVLITRADVVVRTDPDDLRLAPNPVRLTLSAGIEVGLGGWHND